ncbi:hypothetical protein NEUTE1DRAFT_138333 [Neurospora tetrasperma FGSC 2508]|uniref:Rhodopsin domain-containing protein n=1 Tax=Neurospora tetrasperma (strain FGSC 2508 / ATCC MYA-4615 / P0657) TaxID=510951 RepID=F8MNF5_NEUT8|nr:uncharacterized protein NEUTE1DRAFT_138333 [Neurospora tetrasperma FGSC 2508]EGO56130.1 hypothetical protein NEUTE1DRAFT_138333 [Neurospora tetrasperma FGSC 2508]EGZ71017.1 hypothetical protein NEUTE2DRAFT_69052 [Neurospora tetrasperma FGSC 2509]
MASSMIVFHLIATICMSLRFYSKRLSKTKYFLDDWVLLFAWVIATAYIVLALYDTKYGLGFHTSDIKSLGKQIYLPMFDKNHMIQLPLLFTGITICWVSKLSFFITLLRLVRNKTQKTVLWIAMTTSSVFLFSLSIVQPFAQCGSVLVALLNEDDSKHCVPHNITVPMTLAACALAALTDFLLSMVPTLVVWKLQMQRQQKIAIICAMSTGCLAGIVAILKVIKTYETFFLGQQELYAAGLGIALNSVEVSCTVIGASIPFIRLLVPKLTREKKKKRHGGEIVAMEVLQDDNNQQQRKEVPVRSWYGGSSGGSTLNGLYDTRYSKNDDSVAILEVERGM